MKLNEDVYAIVKPDGQVAGDGESSCLHYSREMAQESLDSEILGPFLREMNGTDDLRIVRCRLVEA